MQIKFTTSLLEEESELCKTLECPNMLENLSANSKCKLLLI